MSILRPYLEVKQNHRPFLQAALDAKLTYVVLTQQQYDALSPKEADTLYLIVA